MTKRSDVSAALAEIFVDGPWLTRTLQRCRPHICPFEVLVDRVPNASRILDIGCGAGLFLTLLASQGRLTYGIGVDVRREAIEYANHVKARLPQASQLEFIVDDGMFRWPKREFDVVSMIDVIHHVPPSQQRNMIQRVATAVAPKGIFIYKDMVRRPLWRAWANRLHDLVLARQWIHYFDVDEVVKVAQGCGLTLVHTARIDRLWYGHELAVFQRAGDGG
jgi:2-polyprenyl-3-methyl-5-hydroxy-6-metoxy-1,4-benzoquinol methylase